MLDVRNSSRRVPLYLALKIQGNDLCIEYFENLHLPDVTQVKIEVC